MTLIDLTYLIIQLNHLIDYGLYKDVTINEVEDEIENGTVFGWLETRFADHIDLSMYHNRPHTVEII